jgi:DNA-binding transcriptional MerR regulator
MQVLTVGQVADRLGIRVSAVHYYERRGLLPRVPRERGQRRFDERHLRRLAFVLMCQDAGLSLDDVGVLLTAEPAEWRGMIRDRIQRTDLELARLAQVRHTLAGALRCPADHPLDECPHVATVLDSRLSEG